MRATSLLDEFMPRYDARERHATRVDADAGAVYAAIRRADLGRPLVVRALVGLRSLPAAAATLLRGGAVRLPASQVTLRDFEARGFRVLAESPPHELLIGLEGRFWRPTGDLCHELDAARFRGPMTAGTARGAWNFTVTPRADGGCDLATETRVRCADDAARRRFRAYWLLVRPWSGLIRRVMLREIVRTARHLPATRG